MSAAPASPVASALLAQASQGGHAFEPREREEEAAAEISATPSLPVMPQSRQRGSRYSRRRNRKREGVCLFVFHIPPEVTEEELAKVFSQYGSVVSVKIMMHEPGSEWLERRRRQGIAPQASGFPESRGYGFVNMGSYDDAKRAITKLNGAQLRSKYLKVSFKKPKSMRRRHLERPGAPAGVVGGAPAGGATRKDDEDDEDDEENEENEENEEGEIPLSSVSSVSSVSAPSAPAVASSVESAAVVGADISNSEGAAAAMGAVAGASGSGRSKMSASSPSNWTGVITASLSLQ
jgi:hypothetical protein